MSMLRDNAQFVLQHYVRDVLTTFPYPYPSPVPAVKFHPSGRMLMVASEDKNIRFFQVDGDKNEKIMSESCTH